MEKEGYPEDIRRDVDQYLADLNFTRQSDISGLEEAMRYSLLAPGKRIRPVLCIATGRSLGVDPKRIIPLAASLEMIHTYSLIHDDLPALDDDDLRRNMPTCHVKFGEDVAILAGDALFAEAYLLIIEQFEAPIEQRMASLCEIAKAAGAEGMVGGQYIDVTQKTPMDEAELRRMHSLKTGCLIEASVACVLPLAECSDESVEAYRAFAKELGVLFQIVDDILDVVGADDELGKRAGADERLEKHTFVSTFGLDRARELASDANQKVLQELDAIQKDVNDLRKIAQFIYSRTR